MADFRGFREQRNHVPQCPTERKRYNLLELFQNLCTEGAFGVLLCTRAESRPSERPGRDRNGWDSASGGAPCRPAVGRNAGWQLTGHAIAGAFQRFRQAR